MRGRPVPGYPDPNDQKETMRLSLRGAIAITAVLSSRLAMAAVSDVFPTDLVALPSGAVNMTVYTQHLRADGSYANGRKLFDGELTGSQVGLRLTRVLPVGEAGERAFAPLMVLSYADAGTNPALGARIGNEAAGMGDLRLGGAYWFHIDRPNRTYGMLASMVILPTGDYQSSQVLNVGENRWRYLLIGGWMQPISRQWLIEIAPEIAVYGDNDRYVGNRVLRQETSYALTTYLRYRHTDTWHLYGGVQVNRGGASTSTTAAPSGAPNNTRAALGTLLITSKNEQWQLRYARDVQIDNGLRNDGEISLRYLRSFN